MSLEDQSPQELETLKLSIEKACRGEKAFIRNCAFALVVIAVVAIAGSAASNSGMSITLFGISGIPKDVILKQVALIRIFLAILVIYSFSEWTLSIIDLNRHPFYSHYSRKRSLVVIIADIWDGTVKFSWLKIASVLDFCQKITFLAMLGIILFALFVTI